MSSKNPNGKYQIFSVVPNGNQVYEQPMNGHKYDDFIEAWIVVGKLRKNLNPPPMLIVEDRFPFEPKDLELV